MIAKITFFDEQDGQNLIMLFGDNYKKWQIHFYEYCMRFQQLVPIKFEISYEEWTGYGLKWIAEFAIQKQLDEMVNEKEKSRQYSTFKFFQKPITTLEKILK